MLRLAIAGLLALVCYPVHAVDLAGIEAATVILYQNDSAVCSASVVHSGDDATILLTANHCIDSGGEFSIRAVNKEEREVVSYTVYMVDVLKKEPKADLAVLRLRDKAAAFPVTDVATAEEADAVLFKGAEVLAAGYPGSRYAPMEDLVYTAGLFTGLRDSFVPSVEVPVYRTTSPLWYGKSGGALYVKVGDDWKLVGVASQLNPETPWETALFIPAKEIQKILVGAWAGTVPPLNPEVARETLRNK
jgi:S1-C subfamily serine protease